MTCIKIQFSSMQLVQEHSKKILPHKAKVEDTANMIINSSVFWNMTFRYGTQV